MKMASDSEHPSLIGENGGAEDANQLEQVTIEKINLLNLAKLSVKTLIESTMKRAQPLDDSNTQLQQLFIVIEHCLRHRMKGTFGLQFNVFISQFQSEGTCLDKSARFGVY